MVPARPAWAMTPHRMAARTPVIAARLTSRKPPTAAAMTAKTMVTVAQVWAVERPNSVRP
ncbi:hypothetical protein D3C86_1273250 [compost metagenome]